MVKQAVTAGVLTLSLALGAQAQEKKQDVKKINAFDARLLEATDRRDHQNPVFTEALKAGNYGALVLLGQIGGDACARLRPYLLHASPDARAAAARGAGFCYDEAFGQDMVSSQRFDDGEKTDLYAALGFSGGDVGKAFLIKRVNAIEPGVVDEATIREQRAALFGLMQSIVYDRMTPSQLPSLDLARLLTLTADPAYGYEAAYLLGRLQGLDGVLALDTVRAAVDAAPNTDIKRGLIRILRQFGNNASEALMALAGSRDTALRMEAVRALGLLSDVESLQYLARLASHESATMRHLAISALAGRNTDTPQVTDLIADHLGDPSPWVQVTSLQALMTREPDQATDAAEAWLAGEDYYKAFSAMGLLAQSDERKLILEEFAAAHEGTVRGREAAIALDPSIEAAEQPRETPSWRLVEAYRTRELVLETTRGTICITPSATAPYAAANFMLLADSGKMDGMLWHRVIPNFVAQAGQSEDQSLTRWGMIREEWFKGSHSPGTVGVATAGRDTGSTQFFINTAYNLHLDGRYTVMGEVRSGMDAAYALQEGDVIRKAVTLPQGEGCK